MQLDLGFTREGFAANFVLQLITVIGTLLVAVIIYRWTRDDQRAIFRDEIAADMEQQRTQEVLQQNAVRAALRYEVADNLRRPEAFWPQIIDASSNGSDEVKAASRLVRAAVPIWSVAVWQGAATTVASALPQDQLIDMYRLYATLADILETQRRLQLAVELDTAQYAAQPELPDPLGRMGGTKFPVSHNIEAAAKTLIPDIDQKVKAVVRRGNPV